MLVSLRICYLFRPAQETTTEAFTAVIKEKPIQEVPSTTTAEETAPSISHVKTGARPSLFKASRAKKQS